MQPFALAKLVIPAIAIALFCASPREARAGGGLSKEVASEETSTAEDPGTGKFEAFPFKVSVTVRGGYDDNVNLDSFDPEESFFTNAALGLTYEFGSPRTKISLNAGAGLTYYFDRDDDDFLGEDGDVDEFDHNIFVGFNITHKATPRLTLAAGVFATYQSQADFATLNRTDLTISRQSRDFFFSSNRFSVGYLWTPRFSTVTSYTLGILAYDDDLVSFFEDRFEHTIGNEFRFLVLPTTTAVAEYRFGIVDYTDFDERSSTSHFLLAGVDHTFNPRLNGSLRAGLEFRQFDDDDDELDELDFDDDGNRTHPYAEATVNYAVGQRTSLTWFNRYSLEQPDVPDAYSRSTYRTALGLKHNLTARILLAANGAYQHDEIDGNIAIDSFTEDAFDLSLSVRYAINRNFSLDAGYQHTEVISDEALFRSFSRNRYYAGGTFTF